MLSFSCSIVSNSLQPHGLQHILSFIISWSSLKLMYSELVIPPNYLILCHPFLPLHSFFPRIRVFFNESALCIRWPKYWSFSFGISPPSEYSGLISFRIDWFALSAVLVINLFCGPTLTSIPDYWKNHCFYYMDLCRQNVSVFNTIFTLVISLLPRSRSLLISWLHSRSQ